MSARLADQAVRDRIEQDLDTTLVVEAAAGTGKTTALVGRMVAALMAGRAELDRVVAVTFTDLAAGELKLRLRAAIERARQDADTPADARARLEKALPQLEEARIGTIHSFCADLLRERPVEARVDPLFQVAAQDVAQDLFGRAFERWFEEQLRAPGEGVRRVLCRRTRGDDGPRGLLRRAAWDLAERRDFPGAWRHQPFDRTAGVDAILAEMTALGATAADGEARDPFVGYLLDIGRFAEEVRRREAVHGARDYDGLEAELAAFLRFHRWQNTGFRKVPKGFDKPALLARREALRTRLQEFVDRAGADLAPRLRDELWVVVERYEDIKRRAGCLDFLDLLLCARDLVRGNGRLRAELQQRYTHLFVDEFQDTDPLQAELLLLLAADDPAATDWRRVRPVAGKLFIVGDPKQSIYRFRRADVALYEDVKRQLAGAGAAVLDLTVSFRAVPEIQAAVNAAFAPLMDGGAPSRPRYVALQPHRASIATQPALVALPVPAPYGDFRTIVDWRIEDSLPVAIAAYVDWLVNHSGWTVTERDDPARRVKIEARHVCLLFKRFRSWLTDVTRPYVRALEARGLRHVLVGGSAFHTREEVETLRTALAAVERPDDHLMVFATLRGPLFALGDDVLLAFREQLRTLHPFREIPADLPAPLRDVADALAILRDLHRGRNHRPIAETISRLLAATRAHAGLAIWPTGEQALANVMRLMDLARRAERTTVTSFRAFVDRLEDEAEHGEASEAPIVEEGTEGVRLMTVHRAKGLEFPVVILADLTAKPAPQDAQRWVDAGRGVCAQRLAGYAPGELLEHAAEEVEREREEGQRVLYVAATRARDLLVVPAIGDERRPGWLSALEPVVYPEPGEARRPESRTAPGCPDFGDDSVPGRPANVVVPDDSVMPGLHRPSVGEHRVVWWDPARLNLEVQESVGLRQQRLLEADTGGVRTEAGMRAHADWQQRRSQVRATAGAPSLRVQTATERAAATEDAAAEIAVETVAIRPGRPHGTRFGSLVHAVLAAVDLDADAAGVGQVAALEGRVLGASPDEVAAAGDAVVAALAHKLLRRAAAARRLRRETALAERLADGTLVEGVVDVAFEEDGGWTVVDFKTDVELEARLAEYRRQVALYARAIGAAVGAPVRGVVLRV